MTRFVSLMSSTPRWVKTVGEVWKTKWPRLRTKTMVMVQTNDDLVNVPQLSGEMGGVAVQGRWLFDPHHQQWQEKSNFPSLSPSLFVCISWSVCPVDIALMVIFFFWSYLFVLSATSAFSLSVVLHSQHHPWFPSFRHCTLTELSSCT